MSMRSSELYPMLLPAPRLAVTAWLLSPLSSIGPEGDAELRQSLMRRLQAVVVSAALTLFVSGLAVYTHPQPALMGWFALEFAVAAIRIPFVLGLMRDAARARGGRTVDAGIVDLFVGLGTLWSALLGVGTLLCLQTGDPGLSILAALQAVGTIGAQGVRSPGTPRLNCLQMCLITVPLTVGLLLTPIPLAVWGAILNPLYLFGMMSITRQLHEDYVRLIVARIDNRQRALHCPLTGLPNRAFLNEALAAALGAAEVAGQPVTVMYLDLDGFKQVNDERGHAAGDALLRGVADRLRSWTPPGTIVARLGGDEFAILLRSGADAETEASTLIDGLSRPYDLESNGTATVGLSVGIATSAGVEDAAAVLLRADQALYAAKRAGKGTFRRDDGATAPAISDGAIREIARRMRVIGAPTAEAC